MGLREAENWYRRHPLKSYIKQIAVIVSPKNICGRFAIPFGDEVRAFERRDKINVFSDKNPVGVITVVIRSIRAVIDPECVPSKFGSQVPNWIGQLKVKVRDVDRKNPVGFEMPEIERKCLPGKQVNRDRIPAEGVNKKSIKLLWIACGKFPFQRDTSVAEGG